MATAELPASEARASLVCSMQALGATSLQDHTQDASYWFILPITPLLFELQGHRCCRHRRRRWRRHQQPRP